MYARKAITNMGLVGRVQHIYGRLQELLKDLAPEYQLSRSGVGNLLQAFDVEFGFENGRPAGRKPASLSHEQLAQKLRNERRKRGAIEAELVELKGEKLQGQVSNLWYLRAGLLAPSNVSMRAVADFCKDLSLDETSCISASTIARSKDAWAEVIKEFCDAKIRHQVGGAISGSEPGAAVQIFVVHQQDEASFKMRSVQLESLNRKGKARYSKVLNQSLEVHTISDSTDVVVELMPLDRKDADTLATGLLSPVQSFLGVVTSQLENTSALARIIHIVTGDGIFTNNAACKKMCYKVKAEVNSAVGLKYFLIVIVCAAHISNLNVSVAISEGGMQNVSDHPICANCSRMFRHLMPHYAEEFSRNIWLYLEKNAYLVAPETADILCVCESIHLQKLYGKAVLPDDLLEAFNYELRKPCHLPSEKNPLTLDAARALMFKSLQKHCILVDEAPVITRMFTFADCCFALLRFRLLGLPASVFSTAGSTPAKANQLRLGRYAAYHIDKEAEQALRVSCLSQQLTSLSTSISCQEQHLRAGREPTLVRLAKGEVQERTSNLMVQIVGMLSFDKCLDAGRAIFSLMCTQGSIIIRFNEFSGKYPGLLWQITKLFNPTGWDHAILLFLNQPDHVLDAGYSLELKHEAELLGEAGAFAFLASDAVQRELVSLLEKARPNSLSLERKNFQDKQTTLFAKVKSVATCSRDANLRRYVSSRRDLIKQRADEQARARKLIKMNAWALGVQERADLKSRPRGQLRTQENISAQARRELVHVGDEDAFKAFYNSNKDRLKEKASSMIAEGQAILEKHSACPESNRELLEWLENNDAHYAHLLKTATAKRRPLSVRLQPLFKGMPAVPRIKPEKDTSMSPTLAAKLVASGPGFYYFEKEKRNAHCFFVVSAGGNVWACQVVNLGSMEFSIDLSTPMTSFFRPLSEKMQEAGLENCLQGCDVYAVHVSFQEVEGMCAKWKILEDMDIVEAPRRRCKVDQDSPMGAGEGDESEEEHTEHQPDEEFHSDVPSVCSQSDSEVANSALESSDEADGDVGAGRAQAGTNVVFSNDYFTLVRVKRPDGHYDACLYIAPRLRKPEELGTENTSKSLGVSALDGNSEPPMITFACLRAWMLQRASAWSAKKPARRAWLEKEAEMLKKTIADMGVPGGGTGHAVANRLINTWWPAAIQ